MAILKKAIKRKRKNERTAFLGLIIPEKAATLLSLYSVSQGVTKSSIVKSLIESWICSVFGESHLDTKNKMVLQIAQKSYSYWSNPVGKRMNYNTFINKLKNELESKGLSVYTDEILKIIDDEKNKNKRHITT